MTVSQIKSQLVQPAKRTTTSLQNDNFDNIAYRFFGSQSNDFLPQLIELNQQYVPTANIAANSIIVLPSSDEKTNTPTLKLWD